MKTITLAIAAFTLTGGLALAQATNPGTTAPGANTASPNSGTTTGSSNPAVNATGNAPSSVNASSKAAIVPLASLEKGANSFTEAQARTRLEGAGLATVTDLKKDDQGVWRGKAMQGGKNVTVGFDYKGVIGVE